MNCRDIPRVEWWSNAPIAHFMMIMTCCVTSIGAKSDNDGRGATDCDGIARTVDARCGTSAPLSRRGLCASTSVACEAP